ncbi:glycosyl transferase, family 43, nucleotide-diphospho-sugar transferase [Artemisia annua]|uniref:Glycosyltransferases n=1 Tax=Artemisia annua TaxID=35608 RepID=A0A2U1PGH5_ARTAN|nr:glycosyl transferase, family 43, nucleotide-diphospho-sugar transferase [Artemisia annua]
MKFHLLHNTRRSKNSSPLDSSSDANNVNKSPANILWIIFHCLCCLISLILGFRFSRLLFYLVLTTTTTTTSPGDISGTLTFTTSLKKTTTLFNETTTDMVVVPTSRVVVGRHGIRIRPWPHPDPNEVMKAHRIIESVQREQKVMYGVKNARSLIVVTPTYVRTFQALHLTGLMHTLMNVQYDVVWIVVEAGGVSSETEGLLAKAKGRVGLEVKHIGFEKKMPVFWSGRHELESEMRLHALRVVREEKLDGIVMFADDSNMHSLELFDEVQKVEWIGAVSVGIIAHSSRSDEEPFEVVKKVDKLDEKKSALPVQGPACNSSDKLIGWHTFDSRVYQQKSANYIGDMAVVLPRKVEWCGFVMNSRLVWEESEFRPDWIKDLDTVVSAAGDGVGEIESPLSFVEDSSMVEPLGGCGKKVMMWWLRAEARADSKFPAGWTIDPQLEVTVPAKRTPWPELPPNTEKVTRDIRENAQKNPRKPRSRRSSRGKRKHEAKNTDTHVVVRSSGERSE